MGGFTSGRYGRRSARPFPGEMFTLPVGRIVRSGVLAEGITRGAGALEWHETALCSLSAVRFAVERQADDTAQLSLSYAVRGSRCSVVVRLFAVPQPFGGCRWHYECPTCRRRCRSLFRPIRYAAQFACRLCHRVRYHSQSLGAFDRAIYRADKLRRRVCASADSGERRQWVRTATWEAVMEAAEDLEYRAYGWKLGSLDSFLTRTEPGTTAPALP